MVVALVGVCVGVMSVPVLGISGSGTAVQTVREVNNWPDQYSVKAKAYSLGLDTKARGKLSVPLHNDPTTVWFTTTNVWYYGTSESSWSGTPYFEISAVN